MNMTSTYPTYIYKIIPSVAKPPSPLPEVLPVSDLDQRDGFVHCSTSKQLLGTLNAFFSYVFAPSSSDAYIPFVISRYLLYFITRVINTQSETNPTSTFSASSMSK